MSFNRYYRDELSFLREMGRQFAESQPTLAAHLGGASRDPDVERVLEGFSFLAGRIREKLDDEFPQLTQALLSLLWPHYLRPIPSASIIEFSPRKGMVREPLTIPRGTTEVQSNPVDGIQCRFRTCFDVDLYPLRLDQVLVETPAGGRSVLRLQLRGIQGIDLSQLKMSNLRFYLAGEHAFDLYFWLSHRIAEASIRGFGKESSPRSLPKPRQVGFGRDEALLPYPRTAFQGYRLLQEYFAFPEKFLFVDFFDLPPLSTLQSPEGFEIACHFRADLPSWKLSPENLRLYCTPAVNLFVSESHPLQVTHERTEYRVQPESDRMEIYSLDGVKVWGTETLEERKYVRFDSFQHADEPRSKTSGYYRSELRPSVSSDGVDTYVSFVQARPASIIPPEETVVFTLTCTNGGATGKLRAGGIRQATDSSPEFAQFQNISRVSPPIPPPVSGDLHWRLISHLALNYISLDNEVVLRQLLSLYNWQAASDAQAAHANERRMAGLVRVRSKPEDLIATRTMDPLHRLSKRYGAPVRGTAVEVDLHGEHFAGEGDLFLFATVLNEFFALHATVNSFTQLSAREISRGEIYQWPPRLGDQMAF